MFAFKYSINLSGADICCNIQEFKTKTANDLQCYCCISFFCVSTIDFVTLETLKEQAKHQFRAILINAQELKPMHAKKK